MWLKALPELPCRFWVSVSDERKQLSSSVTAVMMPCHPWLRKPLGTDIGWRQLSQGRCILLPAGKEVLYLLCYIWCLDIEAKRVTWLCLHLHRFTQWYCFLVDFQVISRPILGRFQKGIPSLFNLLPTYSITETVTLFFLTVCVPISYLYTFYICLFPIHHLNNLISQLTSS